MGKGNKNILAINGGSSSIKFSVYDWPSADGPGVRHDGEPLTKWLSGKIERIGQGNPELTFINNRSEQKGTIPAEAADLPAAAAFLIGWLEKQTAPPAAVGHRVVY